MRGLAPWSLLLPLGWAAPAAAQPLDPTGPAAPSLPGRLSVQRATGAEQCPEQGALERRVEGIVRHAWGKAGKGAATALAIEVRFERTSDGAFVARVAATGPKPGQRVLRDANPTCDALGEAVSVAIALLLDSALNDERASPPQPPPPSAAPARPDTTEVATSSPPQRWRPHASLEAGGGYGLGGAAAALGVARFGFRGSHWLFDVGAGGNLPTNHAFHGGKVRTSLLFASARACYLLGHTFAVGPCAQLAAGRLHGEGSGYGLVQTSSLPWTAGGLGLAAETPLGDAAFLTVGATLWVPTRRQTFSVENAGIAWESKPVAGLLTVGLGLRLF